MENNTLILGYILESNFKIITFSSNKRVGMENEWKKIVVKPIILKGKPFNQFNYYDDLKSITRNMEVGESENELKNIISLGFKNIYIREAQTAIQMEITKKGKLLVRKHTNLQVLPDDKSHDNKKLRIIEASSENKFLYVLGLTDKEGKIKPSMQGKFKQINEFIKLVQSLEEWLSHEGKISIIDCGAGNAYLTFGIYHYFRYVLKKEVTVKGIDVNAAVIEKNRERAAELLWHDLQFEVSNIIGFTPEEKPSLTIALHACDTATDEAIMKGISWGSENIICVPCCHHHLQVQMKKNPNKKYEGVLKNTILLERLGDIITDSFRSLILEIMGYKTEVIQYVSTDHTAKNILIKAKKISGKPIKKSVENYNNLKEIWQVVPLLEKLLDKNEDFQNRITLS